MAVMLDDHCILTIIDSYQKYAHYSGHRMTVSAVTARADGKTRAGRSKVAKSL